MQISQALNSRRVARSLVAILGLTLIQVIAAPLINSESAAAFTQGTATPRSSYYGGGGGSVTLTNDCSNGAITGMGTSSTLGDSLYVMALEIKCTPFNSDGSLNSAAVTSTNFFGTAVTPDVCDAGQVAVGINLRESISGANKYIAGLGLRCGNPMSKNNLNIRSVLPSVLPASYNNHEFTCDSGKILVGFTIKYGGGIDNITPRCATFTGFVYAAVGTPTITDNSYRSAKVNFSTLNSNYADTTLSYTATATPATGTPITATGSTSPISISGLRPGMSYTYTVSGKNSYPDTPLVTLGTAPATSSVTVATLSIPGGETDTALSFDGSSQFLTSSATYSTTGDFTMEAWVKHSDTCTAADHIITNYGQSWLICYGGNYFTTFPDSANNNWTYLKIGIPVRAGEWIHLAVVRSSGVIKAYINNTQAMLQKNTDAFVSSYLQSSFSSTAQPQYIGGIPDAGKKFNGTIDEVKLFSSARTISQIWSGAHSQEDMSDPNLISYYDFNEGSGIGTAFNRAYSASSGSDLTVSGPTFTPVASASPSGAYTYLTIPRTLINSVGGWKVPSNVKVASVLVVGGGGGGSARYTTNTYNGAGGGGGGVFEVGRYPFTPNSIQYIRVGTGGRGGVNGNDTTTQTPGWRGESTTVGALSAGGGGGGSYTSNNQQIGGAGTAGGGGGGAAEYWNAYNAGSWSSSFGALGGAGSSVTIGGVTYAGRDGGKGAVYVRYQTEASGPGGGAGGDAKPNINGSTDALTVGPGITSSYSGTSREYGRGGISGAMSSPAFVADPIAPGNGGDGWKSGNATDYGAAGANGIVIIRWITASVPTYTKPTNAYLNVGMTETFTTNVASDSATVDLVRTFKWESTTPSANGAYTLIKQGTGAANAALSWTPTDTSTSGSGYLYRLTVTDSDTAGLFITDSSTAFATINKTLAMTGSSRINKAINLSKNETFTVAFGTSTYRVTMTPVIPGITLDTSTITSPVIKISETATVGTYYETLTVTDSVSASVVIPLTINISAPPNLLNTGEIVSDSLVFNLEAGNSASLVGESGTATTGLTWNDISGSKAHASTGSGVNTGGSSNTSCTAPTYTAENGGALQFTASSNNCYYASSFTGKSLINNYTVEAWFKTSEALPSSTAIVGQATPASNVPTNIFIQANVSGALIVGFYDQINAVNRFANCPHTPTIGAWTHIAGTFDGATLTTYINGSSNSCTLTQSYTPSGNANTLGMIIGKGTSGATNTSFPGSIATVRMYNKSLSAAQILSNFNATKARFDSSKITRVLPTKKYGATLLESFTATSGSDTKTVTFAVGDKTGVDWETITATNRVNLTMQSNLLLGSTYDTVTVTDAIGQSTYLPITLKVAKADAITIRAETLTAVNYSTRQITTLPNVIVSGLVSTDTLTTSVLYRDPFAASSLTCAQGGPCQLWSIGPGGGRVFGTTAVAGVDGVSTGGNVLEIAPANWASSLGEYQTEWASSLEATLATDTFWGAGAINNKLIRDTLGQKATAVNKVLNITINGKSDWYIPTLNELRNATYNLAIGGYNDLDAGYYWTSAESTTAPSHALAFNPSGNGAAGMDLQTRAATAFSKDMLLYLRPIRAFSAARYESVTPPTNAATYTLLPQIESVSSVIAMNYENVIYQNSSFTVNQINQRPLGVYMYGGVVGSPYLIWLQGGNGTGSVTETLTGTSSLTGCAVSNHYLTAAEQKQGFCEVRVVKDGDQNYFAETQTVQMYFMAYVNNQPVGQTGSGSTIALNGKTSLTIDDSSTVRVPRITGFTKSGSSLTINGEGFGNSPVTITFERYVDAATKPTPTGGGTIILVAIPGAAVSGPVLVITPGGRDSIEWLDIP